jgi:hypothetical protein
MEKEAGQAEGDSCLSGFLLIQQYKVIIFDPAMSSLFKVELSNLRFDIS